MEAFTDVGVAMTVVCVGIYLAVWLLTYISDKIWSSTENKIVRGTIKWTIIVWLPLWPSAIGIMLGLWVKSVPLPEVITKLGDVPSFPSVVYLAFCGAIAGAVVKQLNKLAEAKGLDINLPDLKLAKHEAKVGKQKVVAEKLAKKLGGSAPPPSLSVAPTVPAEANTKDEESKESKETPEAPPPPDVKS